jgi:hypothetical protein
LQIYIAQRIMVRLWLRGRCGFQILFRPGHPFRSANPPGLPQPQVDAVPGQRQFAEPDAGGVSDGVGQDGCGERRSQGDGIRQRRGISVRQELRGHSAAEAQLTRPLGRRSHGNQQGSVGVEAADQQHSGAAKVAQRQPAEGQPSHDSHRS